MLNLERVPVSGRLRFNCIAEKWEERIGARAYEQLLQQYGTQIFPSRHPSSQMVQRVMERLTPVSGAGGASWEVVVIDDPEMVNAFVIPGWVTLLALVRRFSGHVGPGNFDPATINDPAGTCQGGSDGKTVGLTRR